jgi:dTDP-4-amino-4,6-dideoxygalactose transaminase
MKATPEVSLEPTGPPSFAQTAAPRRPSWLSFAPPSIGPEEVMEVLDTLRSGWLTTGPKASRFEVEFARKVDAPAALAVSSGTAALHLGLLTAGIGPGDEVVTTTLTFAASVNVIEHVGAKPVLVDVDEDTLNLSVEAVASALTPRTRALLPVHFAGHPVDLPALRAMADASGCTLIEDAAHAFPAGMQGRRIGCGSNPVAFSFYATKNLTTGEGGMLTGSEDVVSRARILALHGMSRDAWNRYGPEGRWQYEIREAGWKYNLSDLQAAIGLAQLRKIDGFQQRRRDIAFTYTAAFSGHRALVTPVERPDVEHAWHLYVLRLRPGTLRIDRDRFIAELTERNIGTSVHFIPIHLHPYFRDKYGYTTTDFPVAYDNYRRMLSLPLHPALSDQDVEDVIAAVLDVAEVNAR